MSCMIGNVKHKCNDHVGFHSKLNSYSGILHSIMVNQDTYTEPAFSIPTVEESVHFATRL